VALSGGVFANALLARLTAERLAERGLFARFCRDVPTNDGGLAYGQLAALAGSDARAETV
jgi:hydrogenase maturation protein HypF